MKCKKIGCSLPPAPGQTYCSRSHAPFGYYMRNQSTTPLKEHDRRKANAARFEEGLKACAKAGMTTKEAGKELGLHHTTVRAYGKDLGLTFSVLKNEDKT